MAEPRFTVRYRQYLPMGGMALLVEDTAGQLYVFTGDNPRPYLHATRTRPVARPPCASSAGAPCRWSRPTASPASAACWPPSAR